MSGLRLETQMLSIVHTYNTSDILGIACHLHVDYLAITRLRVGYKQLEGKHDTMG